MTTERDAYAVLQVDPHAMSEVISAAYRALARVYHPDGATPDAARMAEVNRAYDRLKTANARSRYDDERRSGVAVGPGHPEPYDPWLAAREARVTPADPSTVLDFGRYAGWRLRDIARVNPDYLRWLSRHSTGIRFREAIAECLPGDGELGRRSSVVG